MKADESPSQLGQDASTKRKEVGDTEEQLLEHLLNARRRAAPRIVEAKEAEPLVPNFRTHWSPGVLWNDNL